MTHDGIIHCGIAGLSLGERQIWIYQGSVLDWATRLKPEGFAEYPKVRPNQIRRAQELHVAGYHKLIEYLEKIGVPYEHQQPHPQNLEPHPEP